MAGLLVLMHVGLTDLNSYFEACMIQQISASFHQLYDMESEFCFTPSYFRQQIKKSLG